MLSCIKRINMSSLTISDEAVPEKYILLGGRALTSKIICEEVDATVNPLGENNKLILAPGLLVGGGVPCSGRISIGAKSPLTGGIKESNSGGTAALSLAKLGIKCIIIEGTPREELFYILKLSEKGAQLIPADDYKGMGNYDLNKRLRGQYGNSISIISIGPGGERMYPIASIAVSDVEGMPSRQCGRGGLGAVFASKGLKAIVIDPPKGAFKLEINDENKQHKYKDLIKGFASEVAVRQKGQTDYGTAVLVNVVNKMEILPTKNFRHGTWDKAEKISGEHLRNTIIARGGNPSHICHPGCVIRCSNIYVDKNGQYLTSGFEYETIGLFGSNLLIDDLDVIAQMDRFCDDFGLDTMDLAVAIGVSMEAGLLKFGDQKALLALREKIQKEDLLGRLIAQGAEVTGKVLGVKRTPTVKGQSIACYDPRGLKGTGVTYATSPMGGDHTAANILPGRIGYTYTNKNTINVTQKEGQTRLSKEVQVLVCICDSMGLCFFVGPTLNNCKLFAELVSIRNKINYDVIDIIKMGEKTLKLEYEFNKAAGFALIKNDLPEFFREEPLGEKRWVFDIPKEELELIWEEI